MCARKRARATATRTPRPAHPRVRHISCQENPLTAGSWGDGDVGGPPGHPRPDEVHTQMTIGVSTYCSWRSMARPMAIFEATMPSVRSVLLFLAGLRLPAGSWADRDVGGHPEGQKTISWYSTCCSSRATMARPMAMIRATMPSIRSVDLSLAGLRCRWDPGRRRRWRPSSGSPGCRRGPASWRRSASRARVRPAAFCTHRHLANGLGETDLV